MEGYIYLIRTDTYVGSLKNVYKVGRTGRTFYERYKEYKGAKEIINYWAVNHNVNAEKDVLNLFNKKYYKAQGREYFQGSKEMMLKDIDNCVKTYSIDSLVEENKKIKKFIKQDNVAEIIINTTEWINLYEGKNPLIEYIKDSFCESDEILLKLFLTVLKYPELINESGLFGQAHTLRLIGHKRIKYTNEIYRGGLLGELFNMISKRCPESLINDITYFTNHINTYTFKELDYFTPEIDHRDILHKYHMQMLFRHDNLKIPKKILNQWCDNKNVINELIEYIEGLSNEITPELEFAYYNSKLIKDIDKNKELYWLSDVNGIIPLGNPEFQKRLFGKDLIQIPENMVNYEYCRQKILNAILIRRKYYWIMGIKKKIEEYSYCGIPALVVENL